MGFCNQTIFCCVPAHPAALSDTGSAISATSHPSCACFLLSFPCGGVAPDSDDSGVATLFSSLRKRSMGLRRTPPRPPTLCRVLPHFARFHRGSTFKERLRSSEEFKRHLDKKRLVAQQRAFVLHVMIFASVLLFTFFVFVTMLAAEGVTFLPEVFHFDNAFFLLWLIITLVFLTLISNIVMETHFEPMPCAERIMPPYQPHSLLHRFYGGGSSHGCAAVVPDPAQSRPRREGPPTVGHVRISPHTGVFPVAG